MVCGAWIACTAIGGCPSEVDTTRAQAPTPAPAAPGGDAEPPAASADDDGAEPAPIDPTPSRPVVTALQRVFGYGPARDEDIDAALSPDIEWTSPLAGPTVDMTALRPALRADTPAATRIHDLGTSVVVVQLRGGDDSRAVGIANVADGRVTAMRLYGGKVLGVPPPSSAQPVAIAKGRPSVRNVSITRKLYDAASAREWASFAGLVDARATHTEASGATSMQAGLLGLLGDDGKITIRRHYSAGHYVVVEALVTRPGGAVRRPVAGFVDVVRLDAGKVVASERYVNRRTN